MQRARNARRETTAYMGNPFSNNTASIAKCKENMFEHLTLTLDSDGSDILQAALDKVEAMEQADAAKQAKAAA